MVLFHLEGILRGHATIYSKVSGLRSLCGVLVKIFVWNGIQFFRFVEYSEGMAEIGFSLDVPFGQPFSGPSWQENRLIRHF